MLNLPGEGVNRLVPPAVCEAVEELLAYLMEPTQSLPEPLAAARKLLASWLAASLHRKPRFESGKIVATPGVLASISPIDLVVAVNRHQAGDWGNLDAEDWQTNDESLTRGERLLSSYKSARGTTFWIITEADRSVTTFLLPDEY